MRVGNRVGWGIGTGGLGDRDVRVGNRVGWGIGMQELGEREGWG